MPVSTPDRSTTWTNWAATEHVDGVRVVRPRSQAELVDAVRAAADAGERLRPIGTGHSFTGIGTPCERQLVLDAWTGPVALDAAAGLVTIRSGTPLHRLNRWLAASGLAMANLGDIEAQTVAGALATGTHGTGARWRGLTDAVRGLELVTADGSLLRCTPDENADVLDAARLGLGALGVVSTVTLAVVPAFALTAREAGGDLDEVLSRFDEHADGTDHFEFYWFPHTRRVQTKHNSRVPLDAGLDPLSRARAWWDDEFLSNSVFGAVVAAGRRAPGLVRPAARVCAAALGDRTYTDLSYRVFTSPRRVRFVEMEYAVPRETATAVVRELVRAVERSEWRIAVPVEVRVAAADDVPLSTAYGRDSAYVAVHTPPGCADRAAYFTTLERIAGEVGGRPHWGKLHGLAADVLRTRHPGFDAFVALRDRLDPTGVFSNAYLDTVLGPPPRGAAR